MKIVTVVGARPQFVKAATVSRAIRDHNQNQVDSPMNEVIVHTGQHYDQNMSQVFFDELEIPRPDYNLEVSGGSHGAMTGRMLERIEQVLMEENPDWVLIYGDTNSTLAGALAAAKLHIPVAHVEAGLRSFNMRMPEEVNRILADRISTLLFCPTNTAVKNLRREGVTKGVHNVGDVMYDASLFYRDMARDKSSILEDMHLPEGEYVLVTCHRAENTDDLKRMNRIVNALERLGKEIRVVFPIHPRTRKALVRIERYERLMETVEAIQPVSFLDMVRLEESAAMIVTDSGGVQKEAYFFKVPCVTLRNETEWVETVECGWNALVSPDDEGIYEAIRSAMVKSRHSRRECESLYGDGKAANTIVDILLNV